MLSAPVVAAGAEPTPTFRDVIPESVRRALWRKDAHQVSRWAWAYVPLLVMVAWLPHVPVIPSSPPSTRGWQRVRRIGFALTFLSCALVLAANRHYALALLVAAAVAHYVDPASYIGRHPRSSA